MDSYRKQYSALDDLRLTLAALYIIALPAVFLGCVWMIVSSLL